MVVALVNKSKLASEMHEFVSDWDWPEFWFYW
jgi:hypothetical protein